MNYRDLAPAFSSASCWPYAHRRLNFLRNSVLPCENEDWLILDLLRGLEERMKNLYLTFNKFLKAPSSPVVKLENDISENIGVDVGEPRVSSLL